MNTASVLNRTYAIRKHPAGFLHDVLTGLSATPKYLEAKYFYDANGDALFQQIMQSPEYYLTGCELEILREQSGDIAQLLMAMGEDIDVVELGAGDASKSYYLLRELCAQGLNFTYFPIDISGSIIDHLSTSLPAMLPGLEVRGLHGEYVDMLKRTGSLTSRRRVVMFMGASIGNIPPLDAVAFCAALRAQLRPGDMLIIGFDLKKHPQLILNAYNDKAGITKAFNLNLLRRINRELGGDFDISQFDHYATYDPGNGSCKSYLVSRKNQSVEIGDTEIRLKKDECIYMEISQKYSQEEIDELAKRAGFMPCGKFTDKREWFVDAVWRAR